MSTTQTYRVDGMTCEGCVRALLGAIRKVEPAAFVQVDLPTGTVTVADIGADAVRAAVERAGFDFGGTVETP